MSKFVEIRKTVRSDSPLVVPVEEFGSKLNELYTQDSSKDYYRSLFSYPKSVLDHIASTGSIAKFKQDVTASYLFFDLDSSDLELVKQEAYELLQILFKLVGTTTDKFKACTELHFSGNKGFHITLHTKQEFTPATMKTICTRIAGHLQSFDPAIYNTSRIIRIENTKHQKSDLYKINIPVSKIKEIDINYIKNKAAEPYVTAPKQIEKFDFDNFEEYLEAPKSVVVENVEEIEGVRGLSQINFDKCPSHMPRCVFALSKGVMVPGRGQRHHVFLALARFYKNQGMVKEETHRLLKATAELNTKLYPESEPYSKERIWNECVNSVYGDDEHHNTGGWGINPKNDQIFKQYCDLIDQYTTKPCIMHSAEEKYIFTTDELIENYINFAKNYDKSIIKTGIKFIDQDLEIMRGTVTLIVGAAGSGKTSMALKLLNNASKDGIRSVMFSMDMNNDSLFEKLYLMHSQLDKYQVREMAKHRTDEYRVKLKKVLDQHYKNVSWVAKPTMTSDEMKKVVLQIEREKGKVGFVLVDYAGRIVSDRKDNHANDKHNALKAPELAKSTNAAWVYLNQVSRNHGDSHTPLRTKRAAKGAGDWEEAAQNVITMWRPFADLHEVKYQGDDVEEDVIFNDKYMRCYTAKNRMGQSRELVLYFDKGRISEMDETNIQHYEENESWKEKFAFKHKAGAKSFGGN